MSVDRLTALLDKARELDDIAALYEADRQYQLDNHFYSNMQVDHKAVLLLRQQIKQFTSTVNNATNPFSDIPNPLDGQIQWP